MIEVYKEVLRDVSLGCLFCSCITMIIIYFLLLFHMYRQEDSGIEKKIEGVSES